jgi:hypothetical protein
MSLQRITDSLNDLFNSYAIVFWHDVDGEFLSAVENLSLENVNLIRLHETPALQIKIDIERQPKQRWLLYSPHPEPDPMMD